MNAGIAMPPKSVKAGKPKSTRPGGSAAGPTALDGLIATLDLEPLEQNLYRGRSPNVGWQRVYGGQVLGQALVAAGRTVPADRFAHSMHALFLLAGDPAVPIVYDVETSATARVSPPAGSRASSTAARCSQ